MMISTTDRHHLSVMCQAQASQIVGQQKSGPLQLVGGGRLLLLIRNYYY